MARPKGGKNTRRTPEEKLQLIQEYYASGVGYKTFAREHGIAHSLFCTWLKKYNEEGASGLQHSRRTIPASLSRDEEILQLKLIIAEQQIEISKLKKSAV
ncbi:MAG: transposase [Lachnospiraceae bacterium]|nr:transposase [Lachnospiraceae bacterium]